MLTKSDVNIPVSYTHLDVYKRQLAHMGRVTVINLDGIRQAFSELCAAVRLILERKRW